MKETRCNSFSKAIITLDENTNDLIIEEVGKDDSIVNNLIEILKSWIGVEGVSLTIKRDVIAQSNIEE